MSQTRKNDHRLMQILLGPVVSEKATMVAEKNEQVVFQVARDANKLDVKQAVELLFKVLFKVVVFVVTSFFGIHFFTFSSCHFSFDVVDVLCDETERS